MDDEITTRWAVSAAEADRIEELSSTDELLATWQRTDGEGRPIGDAWAVVVLRDGTVTHRNWDGTAGVPEEVRDLVGDEDTLHHPVHGNLDEFDETDRWIDVVVAPDGSFLRLADEPSAAPGI